MEVYQELLFLITHISARPVGSVQEKVFSSQHFIEQGLEAILIHNPRFHARYVSALQDGAEIRAYTRDYLTH